MSDACVTCGCPENDHPGFLAVGPCDKYRDGAVSGDTRRGDDGSAGGCLPAHTVPRHFALHRPTPDLSAWRTACGLSLVHAETWVTSADANVTCANCRRTEVWRARSHV